ncbi:MAG: hypothetical protein AAF850_09945 [Pseudomonadota bacterium]
MLAGCGAALAPALFEGDAFFEAVFLGAVFLDAFFCGVARLAAVAFEDVPFEDAFLELGAAAFLAPFLAVALTSVVTERFRRAGGVGSSGRMRSGAPQVSFLV